MIYYAHSVENQPESQCQTLSDHLSQVGEMAARFAGFFGAGETARYTGQLHDLGKYSEAFDKRLHGPCHRRRENCGHHREYKRLIDVAPFAGARVET